MTRAEQEAEAAIRHAYDTRLTLDELRLRAESLNRDIAITERMLAGYQR